MVLALLVQWGFSAEGNGTWRCGLKGKEMGAGGFGMSVCVEPNRVSSVTVTSSAL